MSNLIWIIDFAKMKGTSRQTIYTAIAKDKLNAVKRYGTTFIYKNEKSESWNPKMWKEKG